MVCILILLIQLTDYICTQKIKLHCVATKIMNFIIKLLALESVIQNVENFKLTELAAATHSNTSQMNFDQFIWKHVFICFIYTA